MQQTDQPYNGLWRIEDGFIRFGPNNEISYYDELGRPLFIDDEPITLDQALASKDTRLGRGDLLPE